MHRRWLHGSTDEPDRASIRPTSRQATVDIRWRINPCLRSPRFIQGAQIMPFPKQDGRAFTRANIELLQPNQYGVYGLFRPDAWVYVGMGDIRGQLLNHLKGDNPSITRERPAGYVTWVTTD